MKLHLCCGDIYLKGYLNCDVKGEMLNDVLIHRGENPNETTLDKYFKRPFVKNSDKRKRNIFVIDRVFNPVEGCVPKENNEGFLERHEWEFMDDSISEIVMVSAFEHFEHKSEIPYIIKEAQRVLKSGGEFKFDFPDIERTIELYYESDPEFCMELIYCNHKNRYSVHNWGYTEKSIHNYFDPKHWDLRLENFVNHDYPMTGVIVTKK